MGEREEKRERDINTCNVYVYREVHTYRVMFCSSVIASITDLSIHIL